VRIFAIPGANTSTLGAGKSAKSLKTYSGDNHQTERVVHLPRFEFRRTLSIKLQLKTRERIWMDCNRMA
jgi:hypothetical protein